MLKVQEINVTIRKSRREDMVQVFKLIKALAEFEKLEHTITIDAKTLAHDGFDSDHPAFTCLVAELSDGHIMGYALYYTSYSTWLGRSIFLEDIYVQPAYRRNGVGRQLFLAVAKIAHETHSQRMEFHVLSWNPAIDFYKSLGATDMTVTERWHHFRIDKLSLDRLFPPDPQGSTPSAPSNGRQSVLSNNNDRYSGRCSIQLNDYHFGTQENDISHPGTTQSAPRNGRQSVQLDNNYRFSDRCSIQLNDNRFGTRQNDIRNFATHSNNDRFSTHCFTTLSNDGRETSQSEDDRYSTQLSDSHFSTHSNDDFSVTHTNDDSCSMYRSETPLSTFEGCFSANLEERRYDTHNDSRRDTNSAHI